MTKYSFTPGPRSITLPNGIIIDLEGGWSQHLTEYAGLKGFNNLVGAVATHLDGRQIYVLIDNANGEVIEESESYEGICVHIEMMWADRIMP